MQGVNNKQDIDAGTRSALLWVLWRHQGAHSSVGQGIRKLLGKGQYEQLSREDIDFAKAVSVAAPKRQPNTHRVVPVEDLERIQKFATEARDHYSTMNDEVCQSYSDLWQEGVRVCGDLRAIIEDKP